MGVDASRYWCHIAGTNSAEGSARDDHHRRATCTTTRTTSTIDADPYPAFRRLREEAPLYYNEPHDFYALSRFEDVERGAVDRDTFISGRGGVLEIIKADIEMPPGVVIFEDPPTHTIHRSLLSRVFTPKKVAALEPKIRELLRGVPRPARRLRRLRLHRRPRRA